MLWQKVPLHFRNAWFSITTAPPTGLQRHRRVLTLPMNRSVQQTIPMFSAHCIPIKSHRRKSNPVYRNLTVLSRDITWILRSQRIRWCWIRRRARPGIVFARVFTVWIVRVVGPFQTWTKPRDYVEVGGSLAGVRGRVRVVTDEILQAVVVVQNAWRVGVRGSVVVAGRVHGIVSFVLQSECWVYVALTGSAGVRDVRGGSLVTVGW